MSTEQSNPQQEQEKNEWLRAQYEKATKHLASQGVIAQSVSLDDSRYIPPLIAIWKLKDTQNNEYWVLSGDVPADYSPLSVAPDAREALRHFSLKWQMQAENIYNTGTQDKTQIDFANLLVGRAQGLYDLHSQEQFWK